MIKIIDYILQWAIVTFVIHFIATGYFMAVVKLSFKDQVARDRDVISFFIGAIKKAVAWPIKVNKTAYFKNNLSFKTFIFFWCIKRNAIWLGLVIVLIGFLIKLSS